jgi:hypothetical protein
MFMSFREILLTLLEFSHTCSCSFEEANLLLEVKCLTTVMELHLYLPLKPEMKSYIYRIRQKQRSSMYLDEIYLFEDGTEWLQATVVSFRHPNPNPSIDRVCRFIVRRYGAQQEDLPAIRIDD